MIVVWDSCVLWPHGGVGVGWICGAAGEQVPPGALPGNVRVGTRRRKIGVGGTHKGDNGAKRIMANKYTAWPNFYTGNLLLLTSNLKLRLRWLRYSLRVFYKNNLPSVCTPPTPSCKIRRSNEWKPSGRQSPWAHEVLFPGVVADLVLCEKQLSVGKYICIK